MLCSNERFPMKRLLAVAVAIAAVTMFCQSDANAQIHNGLYSGYQFGTGVNASRGFYGQRPLSFRAGGSYNSREDLPYFAKFPPVYYSNIVARPVGISPYAAPAGIRPVEMDYAPVKQVTKQNPFYDGKAQPVKTTPKKPSSIKEKTTWIGNPYLGTVVTN